MVFSFSFTIALHVSSGVVVHAFATGETDGVVEILLSDRGVKNQIDPVIKRDRENGADHDCLGASKHFTTPMIVWAAHAWKARQPIRIKTIGQLNWRISTRVSIHSTGCDQTRRRLGFMPTPFHALPYNPEICISVARPYNAFACRQP